MEEYKESHDDLDMRLTNIHVFDLSFDLSPQDDPCRAWHINTVRWKKVHQWFKFNLRYKGFRGLLIMNKQ